MENLEKITFLSCGLCEYMVRDWYKSDLIKHFKSDHGIDHESEELTPTEENENKNETACDTTKDDAESEFKKCVCDKCESVFGDEASLNRHWWECGGESTGELAVNKKRNRPPKEKILRIMGCSEGLPEDECPICHKFYPNHKKREHFASSHFQTELRKYVTLGAGESYCNLCGKKGPVLATIARHVGLGHNKLLEVVGREYYDYIKHLGNNHK